MLYTTLLLALCAAVSCAQAQDISLKGIKQVQVDVALVDGVGTGQCAEKGVLAKSFGLLEEPIQTETELRLREAGLRVGAGPVLAIVVSGCPSLISIRIDLKESALVDGRATRGIVVTWATGSLQVAQPDGLVIRSAIREVVSKFVNRWLADNANVPARKQ